MENIYLIEYLNTVTKKGTPTGHALNALRDNINIFNDGTSKYHVIVVASREYTDKLDDVPSIKLKYASPDFAGKFITLCKNAKNIRRALLKTGDGICWFTNVEWTFFVILSLLPERLSKGKKIVITQFRDNLGDFNTVRKFGNIRRKLIIDALTNRIDASVNTAKIQNDYCRNIELPDFYYDPSKYKKYETAEKSSVPLCIGTMGERKQILELIDLFHENGMKLKIIGHFIDEEYYQKCKYHADENITIINKILDSEEYYSQLASHRFIVLSYNMNDYKNATSGVLLETIYLKSVPVAPRKLLDFNHINGFGYETLSEIPSIIRENVDNSQMNIGNNLDHYSINYCRKKIFDLFEEIH